MLERVTTDRLVGRRPHADDADAWAAIWTDHRIPEEAWPADLRTADDARRTLREDLEHWQRFQFGPWTLEERGTRTIVGRAGLGHALVGGRPEVQIAYFLSADFWGRGLATEIAREAVRCAFDDLELDSVVIFTMTTNDASQAVIAKLGAEFERTVEHAGLPHLVFRLTRVRAAGLPG